MLRGLPKGTPHVKSWRSWTGFLRPNPGHKVENAARNSSPDIASTDGHSGSWSTLRRRLLLIVTIALLPIVLVSVFQGIERVQRDVRDVREALTQSARAS